MLPFMIKLLFATTTLLLVAAMLNLCFLRSSATVRHRIWAWSLMGLILLPMLSPFLPNWSPFRASEIKPDIKATNEVSSRAAVAPVDPMAEYSAIPQPEFSRANGNSASAAVSVTPPAHEKTLIPYGLVILVVWGSGTFFLVLHLVFSMRAASHLLCHGETLSDPIWERLRQEYAAGEKIRLIQHESMPIPFTMGLRRPVIVVPTAFGGWSDSKKRGILTHELTHIRRRDVFWQILAHVACAVYWFHPLLWLAASRMRIERELACDDAVLLSGERASEYADVLLELAMSMKMRPREFWGCAVAITHRGSVKKRIRALLNTTIRRTPLGRFGSMVLLFLLGSGILFAATISPFAKPKELSEAEKVQAQKAEIAVPADAKAVPIQGKVLMPDGTPAPFCQVCLSSLGIRENPIYENPMGGGDTQSYSLHSGGITCGTDKNGRFHIHNPENPTQYPCPGENILLHASLQKDHPNLVSDPIVFVAQKDQKEIIIPLREGIPVRGRVLYHDGTPATGKTMVARRVITPLLGADLFNKESFAQEFQAKIDENGDYVIYLTEGEFRIKEFGSTDEKTIHVIPDQPEWKIDFELPALRRGQIF